MPDQRAITAQELAYFSDLGTEPPKEVHRGPTRIVRMVRGGYDIELVFAGDNSVIERRIGDSHEIRHRDSLALLASPTFANLGAWAAAQTAHLQAMFPDDSIPIPVSGTFSDSSNHKNFDDVDNFLVKIRDKENSAQVLLINGPAGIGKTNFIGRLAYKRARTYRTLAFPLILHVESRGRMLQNLYDLMAFSLQTLRLNVTYDQIPIICSFGLVTLAIDGFDELGDPNGYKLAWSQVNNLVSSVRGNGVLLLAGRETFVSEKRLKIALTSLNSPNDELFSFSLNSVSPADAKKWLLSNGWNHNLVDSENVSLLFEKDSFALRPFFLLELSDKTVIKYLQTEDFDDLTWFLISVMIKREATKFGEDVEKVTTEDQRIEFLRRFLVEVARDLAENQAESLPADSLVWLSDVAADGIVPDSISGILRNRAEVVAFLENDMNRQGYRKFHHTHIQNHFLSQATIEAIYHGEIPKYLRRNIFSAEFMSSFGSYVQMIADKDATDFVSSCIHMINTLPDSDRARKNLSILIIVAVSRKAIDLDVTLENVEIDEASVEGSAGLLNFRNVYIGQLDARGADIREFHFLQNCFLTSIIIDNATLLPDSLPAPQILQTESDVISDPEEIRRYISGMLGEVADVHAGTDTMFRKEILHHPIMELVGRVARYKPFWIREGDDAASRKILADQHWSILVQFLQNNDLLKEKQIPAAGTGGSFYHVRKKHELPFRDMEDVRVSNFYRDIVDYIDSDSPI